VSILLSPLFRLEVSMSFGGSALATLHDEIVGHPELQNFADK